MQKAPLVCLKEAGTYSSSKVSLRNTFNRFIHSFLLSIELVWGCKQKIMIAFAFENLDGKE